MPVYLAQILFASSSDMPGYQTLYEENFSLVRAATQQQARLLAMEYGQKSEHEYNNVYGHKIRWRFEEIINLALVVDEDLENDVVELHGRFFRDKKGYDKLWFEEEPQEKKKMELRNGFDLKKHIRTIHDYPRPGIVFRDVTSLIADPVALRATIDELIWPFLRTGFDYVVGIEARGFILGGAIAHELGLGFIPIRKKGKLPGETLSRSYHLEYGEDAVEIHKDALSHGERVLMIDDLIATGGTAEAALALLEDTGAEVVAACFVIDLPDLGGSARLAKRGVQVHSLVQYEGE